MTVLLEKADHDNSDDMLRLIQGFWLEHNDEQLSMEEAGDFYREWTSEGHALFMIRWNGISVGFVHLGSRGGAIDWLEDIYVAANYQRKGIGREAIRQCEERVKMYSESLYLEVAARNLAALKLYTSLGYDCLNTITIRKDFAPETFEVIRQETIDRHALDIRRRK